MPIVITNPHATKAVRWLEWAVEQPDQVFGPLYVDPADLVEFTGAYDSVDSVDVTLLAGVEMAIAALPADIAHEGLYRVRILASADNDADLWLAWADGDDPLQSNPRATVPIVGGQALVDLGLIHVGDHPTWKGRIDGAAAGADVEILGVLFTPVGFANGRARTAYRAEPGTVVGYDQFSGTTAGNNLSGRAAPAGGSWATSGAAGDFVFSDSPERVVRTATSGARYAILGTTNHIDTEVSATVEIDGITPGNSALLGVLARWTDSSNFVIATLRLHAAGSGLLHRLGITTVVAGAVTNSPQATAVPVAGASYRVTLHVYATGTAIATMTGSDGSTGITSLASTHLATGGALASGETGLYDSMSTAAASRYYSDFVTGITAPEPIVIDPGRSISITDHSVLRETADGLDEGRPRRIHGSYATFRHAGIDGRASRLVIRGFYEDAEANQAITDFADLQVQTLYTPRVRLVPTTP